MAVESSPLPARRALVWPVALFALGVLLRAPTFSRTMLSDDEAIYATTADALSRGDLLYRDVVDHKPPLVYHVYQLGFAVFGPYETHGAHAAVVLAVLATAAFLLAMRRSGAPGDAGAASGRAAATLYLVFSTTWHDYDALAANCELFLLAPQAAAGWLLLRVLPSGARAHAPPRSPGAAALMHLAVGALVGVSALFKYQALTFLGATIGMLLWWTFTGGLSLARTGTLALCQLLGLFLPPVAYFLVCRAAGNADAALWWFRFNFSYVAAGLTGTAAVARGLRRVAMIGGVALVPYALGIAAAASAVTQIIRRLAHQRAAAEADLPAPATVLGALWLATATVALCIGGRFFGHYFHLVLAPLCLLAAPRFVQLWNRGWSRRAPLLAACVLPAATFFFLATLGRPLAARLDGAEPPYEQVAARIDDLTAPEQRIFVWGNSPQLYIEARRPLGSRFSFCNYMTGESPGTPTETGQRNADANQLSPAWGMLFDDLDRRRPELFVDAAAAGWDGYDKYPITRYPRLAAYLAAHYRRLESRAGVVLYRRLP